MHGCGVNKQADRFVDFGREKHMHNEIETERLWHEAETFDELGGLTAKWLEGELSYCLSNCASPDPETEPLRQMLAYFNRNG